jgi:hypothetical protein
MKSRILVVLASLLLTAGICFGQTTTKDSGQNPGFPRVVAKLNMLNRTRPNPAATLFIPTAEGVFHATMVMICTVPNGNSNGYWSGELGWTDEDGAHTAQISYLYTVVAGGAIQTSSGTIHSLKGSPITVSTSGVGLVDGTQYNAYVVLEQLE